MIDIMKYAPLIELSGSSYDDSKRLILYSLLGNILKTNPIRFGKVNIDTRINLGVAMKSGYGKGEMKKAIKKTFKELGIETKYIAPISLHAEQLVGKVLIRKIEQEGEVQLTYRPNKGYLAKDYIVFEEALELLTHRDFQIARDYIKTALDPIGDNEILKRRVDIPEDKALRYYPNCTITVFFHPIGITESIVTRGLLRRLWITELDYVPQKERTDALKDSMKKTSNKSKLWDEWTLLLKRLRDKKFDWDFTPQAREMLIRTTVNLIQRGIKGTEKQVNYTDIMFFTIRNRIAQLACILAASNDDTNVITNTHIQAAFKDLAHFWKTQLAYVEEKVAGDMSYSKPTELISRTLIEILKEWKATSEEESSHQIMDLMSECSTRLNRTESTIRHYYLRLKERGIIGAIQSEKHGSKVWLIRERRATK